MFEIVPADRNLNAADIASNLGRALQLKGRHCVVLGAGRVDSSTEPEKEHQRTDDADSVSEGKDDRGDGESAHVEDTPVAPSPKEDAQTSVDTISLTESAAEPDFVETPVAAEQARPTAGRV